MKLLANAVRMVPKQIARGKGAGGHGNPYANPVTVPGASHPLLTRLLTAPGRENWVFTHW